METRKKKKKLSRINLFRPLHNSPVAPATREGLERGPLAGARPRPAQHGHVVIVVPAICTKVLRQVQVGEASRKI